MAGWQFSFPPSRTCLWDPTPVGQTTRLHLTKNSWLCVQLLPSAVQLAVRHARQAPSQRLQCLLVGSTWVTNVGGVAVEVDRFDPGRVLENGRGVAPTALIPGDVAIPCQVMVAARSETRPLPHNLITLQDSLTALHSALVRPHPLPRPLDPASLLALRVHCVCSEDGTVYVQCVCVNPGLWCEATPLPPLRVVQTALARNLSGPLPLSALQGRVQEGFLTMEATRKLVLLLNSDPKASTLPLVGFWVSGVGSVHHPLVWAACLHYCHTPSLGERVWGEDGTFLLAVYPEGASQPGFWQCRVGGEQREDDGRVPFEVSHGECTLQPESGRDPITMEMHPAPESSALHTLLVAAEHTHTGTPAQQHQRSLSDCCDSPLPSPHPTPAQPPQISRDCELSCLSLVEQQPPSRGSQQQPPGWGSQQQPPSLGSQQQPPSLGSQQQPPSLGSQQQPPSLGSQQQPPSLGSQQQPPSLGSQQQPPSLGSQQQPPSLGSQQQPPSLGSQQQPPSLGSQQQPPSLGSEERRWLAEEPPAAENSIVVFPEKQQRQKGTEELLWRQELQLRRLHEQVNALLSQHSPGPPRAMADAYTSTGASLLFPVTPHPTPATPPRSLPHPSESSQCSSEGCSVATATSLSVATATSQLSHNSSVLGLDMPSYAHSPSPPTSPSLGASVSVRGDGAGGDSPTDLLFRDQQRFYQNMLAQVNELLESQSEATPTATPTHSPQDSMTQLPAMHLSDSPTSCNTHPTTCSCTCQTSQTTLPATLEATDHVPGVRLSSEVSMLPVPRIMCSSPLLGPGLTFALASGDCTMDEHGQLADMIALKYLPGGEQGPAHPGEPSALLDVSMATQQYLHRHHLTPGPGAAHHLTPGPGAAHHLTPGPGAAHHLTPGPGAAHHLTPGPGAAHHLTPGPGAAHHLTPGPGAAHHLTPAPGAAHHLTPGLGAAHHLTPDPGAAHHLPPGPGAAHHQPSNILDIQRLKALPKLI